MLSSLGRDRYGKYLELISYMISSAQGLPEEPHLYGSIRLLESVKRLIDLMEEEGMVDEDLRKLRDEIVEGIDLVMYDEEKFINYLNGLVRHLARIIKNK